MPRDTPKGAGGCGLRNGCSSYCALSAAENELIVKGNLCTYITVLHCLNVSAKRYKIKLTIAVVPMKDDTGTFQIQVFISHNIYSGLNTSLRSEKYASDRQKLTDAGIFLVHILL